MQPQRGGAAGVVHDAVGHAFHILALTLGRVLVLMVRLTLPGRDDQAPKNVFDLVADLNLGAVVDELGGSATVADDVLECVRGLLFSFHAKNIGHKGCCSNKELGHFVAAINGGHIRVDRVGGDGNGELKRFRRRVDTGRR